MGVFGEHLPEYLAHNIAALPLADKKPMVKRPGRFTPAAVMKLAEKPEFRDADQIGFMCGDRNKITVVDIDEPDRGTLGRMVERCGETPIVAQTATGKFHLYYKHNGERRKCRQLPGEDNIDVLGNGICVAPPSIRNRDSEYKFIEGDLSDIEELPTIKRGALPDSFYTFATIKGKGEAIARNQALFDYLKARVRQCGSEEALIGVAQAFNQEFDTPLPDSEMMRTVSSVWGYLERNELWDDREARTFCTSSEIADLSPAAFQLLQKLKIENFDRRDDFILASALGKSMGWSHKRFLKARDEIRGKGYIQIIHKGGRGKNDPPRAKFTI